MTCVYKYILNDNNIKQELLRLCGVSKCLYNQALYAVKQSLDNNEGFLSYAYLDKHMQSTFNLEGEINYRLLKAQVSQQCLRVLDKNIKSYIKSIKDYKKHPEKYNGMPKLPNYKGKVNQLIYTNQCCRITKDGILKFSKHITTKIPQFDKYRKELLGFQQVRVNPLYKGDIIEIEILYNTPDCEPCNNKNIAGIDLGLGNLVTMVTNVDKPLIINGNPLKSYNQCFNKHLSNVKSELELVNKYKSSKRIRSMYVKRDRYLNDMYHKISRYIVDYLSDRGISTLVVGLNKGWKDSINIGSSNNQAFNSISHGRLIDMLRYKCKIAGITFILNEESYTSKCDGLCLEEICKHELYSGKRIKRGLFRSGCSKVVNADVNGAFNILRKVFGKSQEILEIINRGWLFQPLKLNNLSVLSYSGL